MAGASAKQVSFPGVLFSGCSTSGGGSVHSARQNLQEGTHASFKDCLDKNIGKGLRYVSDFRRNCLMSLEGF